MSENPAPGTDTVLGKTMKILLAFTVNDTTLTFSDLRARTGLHKATLHRLVQAMVGARLLERVGDRYRLSGLVFELGMRASFERTLLEVATPFLEELRERTRETVHLGVRDGTEVVYVAKVAGHHQAMSPSSVGGRMPLHATAIGKVLLANAPKDVRREILARPIERLAPRTLTAPGLLARQLERVAADGIAYEHEESARGIVCVAAPVHDADDSVVAALSVTGPVTRFVPERYAHAVQVIARGISATLARRALR
jgi:DNA-binding IclR family transcriptional regulator